jgi:hypothetical protein
LLLVLFPLILRRLLTLLLLLRTRLIRLIALGRTIIRPGRWLIPLLLRRRPIWFRPVRLRPIVVRLR